MERVHTVMATTGPLAGLTVAGVPAFAQTNNPVPGTGQGRGMMPSGEAMKLGMTTTDRSTALLGPDEEYRYVQGACPGGTGSR
jgi:hypothetical protein